MLCDLSQASDRSTSVGGCLYFYHISNFIFLYSKWLVIKACLIFLEHCRDDTSKMPSIESVAIVCEFVDVFPAYLCGLLPDRDIDF